MAEVNTTSNDVKPAAPAEPPTGTEAKPQPERTPDETNTVQETTTNAEVTPQQGQTSDEASTVQEATTDAEAAPQHGQASGRANTVQGAATNAETGSQQEQTPDKASEEQAATTDGHDMGSASEQTTTDEQKTTIKHAFSAAARTRTSLTSNDLSLVGSVQVKLTLNVGSKSMTIADVLNLERGSVITLNRREHDPLDVLINGVLFARGEVVRTGDYYGLRILEII